MKDAPELALGLSLYFDGFLALMSDRGDMGIYWTAMRQYCADYGIEGDQREYFYDLVREMDQVFISFQAAKIKKAQGSPTPPQTRLS